jgi:hypothetical protein
MQLKKNLAIIEKTKKELEDMITISNIEKKHEKSLNGSILDEASSKARAAS